MNIVIAPDIFGITPSLTALVKKLSKHAEVAIIDPYHGEVMDFKTEQLAYQEFLDEGGLDSYTEQLKVILTYIEQPVILLGFSAGASALWRLVDKEFGLQGCHFIGFYPGKIRHYLDVVPNIATTLLMPNREAHFDIDQVIAQLPNHELLDVSQLPFGHGFMNPKSDGYDARAFASFERLIGDVKLMAKPAAFRSKKPSA